MSQTLIVHSDKSMVDLLNLNLPIYVGTDIIIKESFKDAQTLIEHHPGIHLIVCAGVTGQEQTAEALYKYISSKNRKIPLIVFGDKVNIPTSHQVTLLPSEPALKSILQIAAKYLNVTPKKMIEAVVPDFFPIDIKFFLNLKSTPCTLYISSADGADFQQEFNENEALKSDSIIKLIKSGHANIYVNASQRLKLVNFITAGLMARLSNTTMTIEDKVSATDEAIKVVQQEAINQSSPVSQSIVELTDTAIRTCLEIAKLSPSIANLVKKLLSSRTSHLYKHSQLIIAISQHIIDNVKWGSAEQKEKLAFVAFFHDICLTEDRLEKYSSDYSVSVDSTLSKADKEMVFNHAKFSAELVQKFPTAPLGSDIIIMQHHGMTSGQGFAKTYTNSISPLAIVFIVAEEMAHMILELNGQELLAANRQEMIEKLNVKYNRSKYQKIIETLITLNF